MTLTRRTLLQGAAASAALVGARVRPGWASDTNVLGQMQITTLSDGFLTLPQEFIFGATPQSQLTPILEDYGIAGGPLRPECNVTLMRDGARTVLFDTGSGTGFQDSAGLLAQALAEGGIEAGDVTHVVFTHCHPDHLWGVLDDFDDPLFANATHMMGRVEWDYWWNPETVDTIESGRMTMAVGAKRRMEMLEDQITFFDDGDEVLPGVAARASYGHTPGHMSFELRSGSDSVMVVGDAIGNNHVAFAAPKFESGSDQDRATAATTRLSLLDQLAVDRTRIIGFHLPGGGMGHVERHGGAYRFLAEGA